MTIIDATLVQKYLAGALGDNKFYAIGADIDGDQRVTIMDATAIQKYLVTK